MRDQPFTIEAIKQRAASAQARDDFVRVLAIRAQRERGYRVEKP